jgi:hypothetical protein
LDDDRHDEVGRIPRKRIVRSLAPLRPRGLDELLLAKRERGGCALRLEIDRSASILRSQDLAEDALRPIDPSWTGCRRRLECASVQQDSD